MIFYLVEDHDVPSWGIGMLYEHVALLTASGFAACALHQRRPFRPTWRELEVPVRYLDEPGLAPAATDVIVVPEVMASHPIVAAYPWRRVVFVQGSFLVVAGLGGAPDYPALGYEAALAVLPHVATVVERHFGLAATVVPPIIAPYFFGDETRVRAREVLLVSKDGYREAGIPDERIVRALLERELARRPGWSLVALRGLQHREVAERMQRALLLVNVNSLEAFNTTVPEAMAAGCVPLCYEAVGGRDFLRDGVNALVFATHEVYNLVERVLALVDAWPANEDLLARLRQGGRATAATFTARASGEALAGFFARLLASAAS